MNKKYVLLAVTAAIISTGAFALTRPTACLPSDFRDAPRDAAFDSLKDAEPAGLTGQSDIPVPKAAKPAEQAGSIDFNFNSPKPAGRSFLTAAQAEKVRGEIDAICGDSWCEGEYNFDFTAFNCGKDSCALVFYMMNSTPARQFKGKGYVGAHQNVAGGKGVCVLTGVTKYSDLMDRAANGHESLNEKAYGTLSGCIDKTLTLN